MQIGFIRFFIASLTWCSVMVVVDGIIFILFIISHVFPLFGVAQWTSPGRDSLWKNFCHVQKPQSQPIIHIFTSAAACFLTIFLCPFHWCAQSIFFICTSNRRHVLFVPVSRNTLSVLKAWRRKKRAKSSGL